MSGFIQMALPIGREAPPSTSETTAQNAFGLPTPPWRAAYR
jgi:hypothetical protein